MSVYKNKPAEPKPILPTSVAPPATIKPPIVHVNADRFIIFNPRDKFHMREVARMLPKEYQC